MPFKWTKFHFKRPVVASSRERERERERVDVMEGKYRSR